MIQILLTILLSSVKFAMTFPLAIVQFKFGLLETILWTNVGGVIGIYFFAYLSDRLIDWWNRTFRKAHLERVKAKSKAKKKFSKRNRRIVHIKQNYGLIGIALATPFLLSIPLGAFLVVRFYRSSRIGFIYLIASNLVWSVIYSGFYLFWDDLIFHKL